MKSLYVFLSGCMVYVLVAACAAMDPGRHGGGGGSSTIASGAGGSGGMASSGDVPRGSGGAAGHGGAPQGGHGGSIGSGGTGGLMDPVPQASADPTSGTRLKVKRTIGSDGSSAYINGSWYDSVLMSDCWPLRATDGTMRCIPPQTAFANYGLYGDASCSRSLAYTTCGVGTYYWVADVNPGVSCEPIYRLFRVGAEVSSVYQISRGTCVAATMPVGAHAYELGTEIQPSDLVELTTSAEP